MALVGESRWLRNHYAIDVPESSRSLFLKKQDDFTPHNGILPNNQANCLHIVGNQSLTLAPVGPFDAGAGPMTGCRRATGPNISCTVICGIRRPAKPPPAEQLCASWSMAGGFASACDIGLAPPAISRQLQSRGNRHRRDRQAQKRPGLALHPFLIGEGVNPA